MDTIRFYTRKDISVEDIAICAMKVGHKTYFRPSTITDLMVEFVFEDKTSAWGIWKSDVLRLHFEEPHLLGEGDSAIIEKLKPSVAFGIEFKPYSMPQLKVLLKAILQQFGGWVQSGGGLYSIDDIDSLGQSV